MHSRTEDQPRGLNLAGAPARMESDGAAAQNSLGGACEAQARRDTVGERLDEQIKRHEAGALAAKGLKHSLTAEVLASDAEDFRRMIGRNGLY